MNALERLKPAQQLALFGVLSGVLTTLVRWEAFVIRDTSVLPGLFFGSVLAYALWRWETKRWIVLAGVVIGIVIAWVAAWNSAVLTHDFFDRSLRWPKPATWITLGLLAGFVGSALTAATLYLFSRSFRTRSNWLRVIVFGTAAGILLSLPELGFGSGTAALLPLFVVWQAGVAHIVGAGITGLR